MLMPLNMYCKERGLKPKSKRGQRRLALEFRFPITDVGNVTLVDAVAADEQIRKRALFRDGSAPLKEPAGNSEPPPVKRGRPRVVVEDYTSARIERPHR